VQMMTTRQDIVLIIDDTPLNLKLLIGLLESLNIETLVATSADIALDNIHHYPPDLILLDVMMPHMDGYELCCQLKADPTTKDIPVIFMTALDTSNNEVKGLSYGAVDYITKPIQVNSVAARVQTHLSLRKAQREIETQNRQLQQKIAEQAELMGALQDSENRYRRLIQDASVGILMIDTIGNITTINPVLVKMLDSHSIETYKTINLFTFSPLVNAGISADFRHCLETGESNNIVRFYTTKLGKSVYLEILLSPTYNAQGDISGVQAFVKDITQRKRTELALQNNERKYRQLVETANCIILELDIMGYITFFNRFAQTFFGYTEADILGRHIIGTIMPERESTGRNLRGLVIDIQAQPKKYHNHENENITRYGRRVWVNWSNELIYNDDQEVVGILCVGVDVTQRKQTELALQKSERKFRNFVEQSTDGITLINEEGVVIEWNDSVTNMTGISRQAALGQYWWDVQLNSLPPDQRTSDAKEQLKLKVQQALQAGESPWLNRIKEMTYQPVETTSDRIIQQRFFPIKTDTGFWIGGISTDITANKVATDKIRKLSRAVEQSGTAIVITDLNGKIEFINPAFSNITGYTNEDIIGQTPRILKSNQTPQKIYKKLWATITQGEVWEGEFLNRKKNGELYWEFSTISPIKDEAGKVTHYVDIKEDITARKQAEETLRRYERIVSATTDFMSMIDQNYIYQVVNQTYLDATSKKSEEVIGHSVSEFLGVEEFENRVKIMLDLCLAGETIRFNNWSTFKTLGRRYLSVTFSPYIDLDNTISGVVITARDITELKQVEQMISKTNQNLEARVTELATLNCIAQTVSTINELQSTLDDVTQQIAQLLHVKSCGLGLFKNDFAELVIVSNYRRDQTEPTVANTVIPISPSLLTSRLIQNKQHIIISDAQTNPITQPIHEVLQIRQVTRLLIMPLITRGEIIGIIAIAQKKTDPYFTPATIKLLETVAGQVAGAIENGRLFEEAQQAKIAAEQANQAKSRFLANMSHELRTPLTAILGFAELIAHNDTLSIEHQENLKIIQRNGEHLLMLINDVLNMSKIEAGHISLDITDFNLHQLLNDMEEMFRFRAEYKQLSLIFNTAVNLPFYVRTDAVKLRQVLINLLNNALKFTEQGNIMVKVDWTNDSACQDQNKLGWLSFQVIDTGSGIPSQALETVFEAFVQTQIGQTIPEGTGLGLSISKNFVQLMGGEITAESPLPRSLLKDDRFDNDITLGGPGTVISFSIQCELVESNEEDSLMSSLVTSNFVNRTISLAPGQPDYRILIADDKSDNRYLLFKLLQPLGFIVQEASNGQEAVEVWRHWQPHLIWMDLHMPVMDGYTAIHTIRQESLPHQSNRPPNLVEFHTISTPVISPIIIAITANILANNSETSLPFGCNDLIYKPFQEVEVFDLLAKHLRVKYSYETTTLPLDSKLSSVSNSTLKLLKQNLAQLPASWLKSLNYASALADSELTLELIEQIAIDHADLAENLTTLVNQFRFDTLLTLTK